MTSEDCKPSEIVGWLFLNISRLNAGDVCGVQGGVGFGDAVGEIDGAGGVFDDDGFEAEVVAVDRGVADTEVVGEAAEEQTGEVALAEVAGEAGWGEVVVF